MKAFAIGFLISMIAALPEWRFVRQSAGQELHIRLKLWAIGAGIRFAIIGGALLYLFTRTGTERIPVVFGVIAAYFLVFLVEVSTSLRVK